MCTDISFQTADGKFNYRVAMILLYENQLLVMKDKGSLYYYVPGGRVHMQEDAQHAICREMMEELNLPIHVIRPLWFVQSYFQEDVSKQRFHEISLFYLVKPVNIEMLCYKHDFEMKDNTGVLHEYHWVPLAHINEIKLYPKFISEKIHNLPKYMEVIIESS